MFQMHLAAMSCNESLRAEQRPVVRPPPGLSLPQQAPPPGLSLPQEDGGLQPPPGLSKPLDLCGAWRRGVTDSDCSTTDASASEPTTPTSSERIEEVAAAEESTAYMPGRILQQSAAHCKQVPMPLSLAEAVERTTSGTPACPSVGSAGHWLGLCKPCDFFHRDRCTNAAACKYCHLCGPEEGRRRRKQKQAMVKAAVRLQKANCAIAAVGAART